MTWLKKWGSEMTALATSAVISLIVGVAGSVMAGIILRRQDRDQKKAIAREEDRAEKDRILLKTLDAGLAVNTAMVVCIETGRTNGELKAAKKKMDIAQAEMDNYMQRKSAV